MEEFKSITGTTSVVKIAGCFEKIYTKIREYREKKVTEHNIKEIEFLKTQCKSLENVHVSVMSCQTFVRLVEDGLLDSNNVLNMLISMLPSASPTQHMVITEGILSLLLLELKRRTATLHPNEVYKSQYGLKTQQHPMIMLLLNPSVNMNDVSNKISGICNHLDKQIKEHSIEYMRPVFLYILCNPHTFPDSKTIWSGLLTASKHDANAKALMQEILAWSKISTAATSLLTSTLLIEAIDFYLLQPDLMQAVELCLYQAVVINQLTRYGIDPRPSLQCMLRVLHTTREHTQNHYNVLLIMLAESVHLLTPNYLNELLRLIAFIVVEENCGHQYILNMCLDGIIQWMSQTAFIPAEALALSHQIIRRILLKQQKQISTKSTINTANLFTTTTTSTKTIHVRNFHINIAMAFNLAKLVESFDESEFKDIFTFVDALNIKSNSVFCQRLHLFLRALFLSKEPSVDCWFKIYETNLQIIKTNHSVAYDFLMTYIFKLVSEQNPELQLELLRGLPNFAVSKDNIPMILNTIKKLTVDNVSFSMDLYLRLWRVDSRTYPFLIKLLSTPFMDHKNSFEIQIAKTYIIREICYEKPTQHGADLVSHLSDTLNNCTDENGDLATSLALDAIVALCESHTINITSTWRALCGKFQHETRPHAVKSLFKFFATIPQLQTPTIEYETLVDEALDQLWRAISHAETDIELIREALNALKNYELGTLLTLRHIPLQYQHNINRVPRDHTTANGREVVDLQREAVPGQVWVQLLQQIRPECGAEAAELISHHIYSEISSYRSGVYRLPDGKVEPRKLQGLFVQSPLRALVDYLVNQARLEKHASEPQVVIFALRAISRKFPKPIPPVDWSFLHSFFHMSFEARKYCILIAKNQLLHSGSARRLLENFLIEFEPNCFEEDLLLLLSLLPEIANGVSVHVIKNFTEKVAVYCFKESKIGGFTEGCLFEKFLDSVKHVFTGKCEIAEILDVFTLIVERYIDTMSLDSRLFERYTEVVAVLHPNTIDGLTSPANWWETPVGKLKKATIIRCYLVLYNDKKANPLKWLTPVIDAYVSKAEEQEFLYRHLAATLYAFNNDEQACNWIMEMSLQIQALLAESSNKDKLDMALYLIEIWILAVDILSGCAVLLGKIDVIAVQRTERYEIFPESLQLLCEHVFWKDQESKIYEFLYALFKNFAVPVTLANMFKEAIICSRNKPYFDKGVWNKYVGMRK